MSIRRRVQGHANAAVLGQAALGDVQLGHQLDARGDGGLQAPGRGLQVVEDAVDAIAHPQGVLGGLDMDVRGFGGDGLLDEEVDQPDDRGLEGHVAKLGDVLLAVAVAVGGPHALDDLLQRGGGAVGALDGLEDGLPRRDAERDVERQGLAQLVDEERIGGVGGRDGQGRALEGNGACRVLPQVLGGEVLQHRRREGQLLGGEEHEPALGGERPEDIVLGGGAQLDQGIADPLRDIARARLGERQHLGGDDSGLEQRLSEILRRDRGRPVYRHSTLIMRAAPEGVKNRETRTPASRCNPPGRLL